MKITYELKDFDKGKIINKFDLQKNGNAQLYMANSCYRRMHKYVPLDTGALATTVSIRPSSITYEMPYAHRQYTTNQGKGIRGKYWDKKMVANEKDALAREVGSYIKSKGSR